MPELTVILGVEAAVLVFVAAMNLRARRMDVLSGRFFETPAASPGRSGWTRSIRAPARHLQQLTRSWARVARMMLMNLWPSRAGARRLRSRLQARTRLLSRSEARARRSNAPGASGHAAVPRARAREAASFVGGGSPLLERAAPGPQRLRRDPAVRSGRPDEDFDKHAGREPGGPEPGQLPYPSPSEQSPRQRELDQGGFCLSRRSC